MNYREALTYIHSLDKFGSRPGLDRVQRLFDLVPESLEQKFIHVAGTNGKGSVSSMLSDILRTSGYKVGLFISPYIVDFRERIQIGGEMISEDELAEAVTYFKPLMDRLNAEGVVITEFEFLTVVGFWIFKHLKCDIVVCEVGMGGLLDSTNLIHDPLCSVITRIDLDHTAVLGDTVAEIAAQKCGIIKRLSPVASSAQYDEAMNVIIRTAQELNCPLYRGGDVTLSEVSSDINGTAFTYMNESMRLNLIGAHQVENLRCALAAVEALRERHGLPVTEEHIKKALCNVRHPARFEKLGDDPLIILDGAHNPNGLAAFSEAVRQYAPDGEKTLIIGMLADKDSRGLSALKGLFARAITTNINNPRALSAEALAERVKAVCADVEVTETPCEAFDKALKYGGPIFICGSLYLASEIRPKILKRTLF